MQKQLFSMYTSQRYNSQAAKLAFTAGGTLTDVYMYSLVYPYQTTEQQQYPSWTGVMHGGDIPYVWGDIVRDSATQGENPEASILSFNMMKYWANFAKTGNPSMSDQGVLTDVEWPRYRNLHRHYLKLDGNDISADSYLGGKDTAFWNFIMPTLRVSCPLYMP
uniref:acetylcholinesterase 1-like n=1 Tax=Styela clava TaxID=7725 RepID=UPI00193953B2|nr:acetylcholinesterase 1-like [Styela clava]